MRLHDVVVLTRPDTVCPCGACPGVAVTPLPQLHWQLKGQETLRLFCRMRLGLSRLPGEGPAATTALLALGPMAPVAPLLLPVRAGAVMPLGMSPVWGWPLGWHLWVGHGLGQGCPRRCWAPGAPLTGLTRGSQSWAASRQPAALFLLLFLFPFFFSFSLFPFFIFLFPFLFLFSFSFSSFSFSFLFLSLFLPLLHFLSVLLFLSSLFSFSPGFSHCAALCSSRPGPVFNEGAQPFGRAVAVPPAQTP